MITNVATSSEIDLLNSFTQNLHDFSIESKHPVRPELMQGSALNDQGLFWFAHRFVQLVGTAQLIMRLVGQDGSVAKRWAILFADLLHTMGVHVTSLSKRFEDSIPYGSNPLRCYYLSLILSNLVILTTRVQVLEFIPVETEGRDSILQTLDNLNERLNQAATIYCRIDTGGVLTLMQTWNQEEWVI